MKTPLALIHTDTNGNTYTLRHCANTAEAAYWVSYYTQTGEYSSATLTIITR